MARRLNTFVHVDGVAYGPEDDIPAAVAKKITAPDVWADDQGAEESETAPKRARSKADDETSGPEAG